LLYKNYILEFFNLDETSIRLKEVRKIYNLQGNINGKYNIETFLSNISNIDINTSPNFISNKLMIIIKIQKLKQLSLN
jgi:hypothetical protein